MNKNLKYTFKLHSEINTDPGAVVTKTDTEMYQLTHN